MRRKRGARTRLSSSEHNLARDYDAVARRLSDLGIMINGSFVFRMDDDGPDVFNRTIDRAVRSGITSATFHIKTRLGDQVGVG